MPELPAGSDLALAPTLRPLVRHRGQGVRQVVDALASSGFEAIQLDAGLAGMRPRELDKRARQDLLAMLARRSMRAGGVDLFIPRQHLLDLQTLDRAVEAMLEAVELAADLGRVPLSTALPVRKMQTGQSAEALAEIVAAAEGRGVGLSVHAEDMLEPLKQWLNEVDLPVVGAGIDAAALLGGDVDPAQTIHHLGPRLMTARLSDASTAFGTGGGAVRCTVGEGELDLLSFRLALDMAPARQGPVILDLRGLEAPWQAAETAHSRWKDAAPAI